MLEQSKPTLLAVPSTVTVALCLQDMMHATLEETPEVSHPMASTNIHGLQEQNDNARTIVLSRRASLESPVVHSELCFGQHDLIPWKIDNPELPKDLLSVFSDIC